jgi:hypothetical protein
MFEQQSEATELKIRNARRDGGRYRQALLWANLEKAG